MSRSFYEGGLSRCRAELALHERRSLRVSTARLVSALAVIGLVVSAAWGPLGRAAWAGACACATIFAALVVLHARVLRARDRSAAGARYHELGLLRLAGEHGKLPPRGEGLARAEHPYAGDLDLFGRGSLLQLVDATQTGFGEARLVSWLDGGARAPQGALLARQAAVRELAARPELRERLAVLGAALASEGKPDPAPMIAWAEAKESFGGPATRVFCRVWPLVTVGTIAAGHALGLAPALAWLPYVVGFGWALATRARASKVSEAVTRHEGGARAYAQLLGLLEEQRFEAPLLVELVGRLRGATHELRRLDAIVGFLEARSNEVFRLFLSPLLLVEQNCVLALEAWRARTGSKLGTWFDVLGEIEALASLAQLSFDNPDWCFPELAESPTFVADGLGHPLIPAARRVGNDVAVEGPGRALVVTGSNMSGKSTLLRSAGVAVVLGLAGGPVCAKKLALGPLRLATSMRVVDSLEEGTSRFYAELKRLRAIVGMASQGPGVFFLLDEVLHGTNTRERLIGARAVVRSLLARGALGAVSTHDLAIGDLEEELGGRVRNVHFEEQVEGDAMTFDFALRPGVVHSSNALRLMKAVGLEVE